MKASQERKKVRRALISVSNKTGLLPLAIALHRHRVEILSTGGTAKFLVDNGIPVVQVSDYTGQPEILEGRVKTLVPRIHGGILARRSKESHLKEMKKHNILPIDLVVVNLYPFEEKTSQPGCTREEAVENIDIGGPTMVRAAAKNVDDVVILTDPRDYPQFISELDTFGTISRTWMTALQPQAFARTATYDMAIAKWLSGGEYAGMFGKRVLTCKYGENAYQEPAGLYQVDSDDPLALPRFKIVAGTDPSFNNLCDLDRLLQTATHVAAAFDINRGIVPRMAIAVKHGNACGAAFGNNDIDVVRDAVMGDPLAIFGGLVLLNFPVTEAVADTLLAYGMPEGKRRLLDGIIAPSFDESTIEMLKRKGDKCRLIANPALEKLDRNSLDVASRLRYVRGGFLRQPNYAFILDLRDPDLKKFGQATVQQENDMLLAKAIGDTSNSNTITIVGDKTLKGNGVGQQARVYGSELADTRAKTVGHPTDGASASSDSFFPELDGVEVLARAGIKAIVSTSGSVKDDQVIAFCKEQGIVLYLIPDKKGRGFFGH